MDEREAVVTPEEVEEALAPAVPAEEEEKVTSLLSLEVIRVEKGGKTNTYLLQYDPAKDQPTLWRAPQVRIDTFTVPDSTVPGGAGRKTIGATMLVTARTEYEDVVHDPGVPE